MRTCVKSVVHGNLKPFAESVRVVHGRGTADLHPLSQVITETFNRIMRNSSELRKLLVTSNMVSHKEIRRYTSGQNNVWSSVNFQRVQPLLVLWQSLQSVLALITTIPPANKRFNFSVDVRLTTSQN